MSDESGNWVSDARVRSEAEIAELVPYVSKAAIDSVRDALRRIVLENQDHSAILDKLLPELEKMPSKRSQALDWLDVELARLSDDDIILLMGKLQRMGGHEVLLKRITHSHSRFRIPRRLWPLMGAAAAMFMVLAVAWGNAFVSQRDEERENAALRVKLAEDAAKLADMKDGIDKLIEFQQVVVHMNKIILTEEVPDEESWLILIKSYEKISHDLIQRMEDGFKEENDPRQDEP